MPITTSDLIQLGGRSASNLRSIAAEALRLASDLEKRQPSYELALAAGVQDRSYSTVRWGWVTSYAGEAAITMADGSQWRAMGHGPEGSAQWVSRAGWIEFVPLATS